jgi:hypothetical protein
VGEFKPIFGMECLAMRFSNQGRLRQQVRFLRRQYLQDRALPFSDILTDDCIGQTLAAVE